MFVLMMKIQIGLGVLFIFVVFDVFGLIFGVFGFVVIGIIMIWCNWVVGIFKFNYCEVYGVDDVMGMMFGCVGWEIFVVVFCFCRCLCVFGFYNFVVIVFD